MPKKSNNTTWKDIKSIIGNEENGKLLKLISDLYSLNKENSSFINSRFLTSKDNLEPYKKINKP